MNNHFFQFPPVGAESNQTRFESTNPRYNENNCRLSDRVTIMPSFFGMTPQQNMVSIDDLKQKIDYQFHMAVKYQGCLTLPPHELRFQASNLFLPESSVIRQDLVSMLQRGTQQVMQRLQLVAGVDSKSRPSRLMAGVRGVNKSLRDFVLACQNHEERLKESRVIGAPAVPKEQWVRGFRNLLQTVEELVLWLVRIKEIVG